MHREGKAGNSGGEVEVWGTALGPQVSVCHPQLLGCHPSLESCSSFPSNLPCPKFPIVGLTPCHMCSL